MKEDYLKDEGNSLRVQKHQLEKTESKLSEIDSILSSISNEQKSSDDMLDSMLNDMEGLLESNPSEISDTEIEINLHSIEQELESGLEVKDVKNIEEIDNIQFDVNMSWDEYIKSIEDYGFRNNLNLEEDPFKHIMSKSQQIELQKRIKEDFTFKNANCDKYDYMIAGTCGVISGLVDILFVGMPNQGSTKNSVLGTIADDHANKITEMFASFIGWKKENVDTAYQKHIESQLSKGKEPLSYENFKGLNVVQFLERKFKINYDQQTTSATNGAVDDLNASNHHLKSLGHSPDIIGLFFSILNQFTNTSTFISNGQLITISNEKEFELQGHNFIAKIFCGFANWLGHLISDWSGSQNSKKKGTRGSGIPMPFYTLFLTMNIGEFGKNKQTFAQIATKVFEKGYDFRHGMAMAVPVAINELLIRFMYTMKAHFYHEKDWKDSIPKGSIPEVRRMLLVGHGTLCLMDGADAAIRSGGDMVQFLLRTNLLAWVRFGQLSLKELKAWYKSGHIDEELVDEYLEEEYRKMLNR